MKPESKTRLVNICKELSDILGLTQGSIEIHCHHGKPKQVHIHDKSIKFDEDEKHTLMESD